MQTGFRIWTIAAVIGAVSASGCELVGDIFQAGMAVGVFLVVFVIALAVFLIGKLRRRV